MLLHVVDTGLSWYPEDAKPHLKQQLDQYLTDELKYFTTSVSAWWETRQRKSPR